MKFAALATIKRGDKTVGIRLLNIEDGSLLDKSVDEVTYALSRSNPISVVNLGIENGILKWTMGVESRYPVIDAVSKNVQNSGSAVIVGISNPDAPNKMYKIVNYTGKVLVVNEATAVKYARDFQIANCKLYDRGGKQYLQAISGEIPVLVSKASVSFGAGNTVTITIPEDGSLTNLRVPDRIYGIDISNHEVIHFAPRSACKFIKSIRFGDGIRYLDAATMVGFTELESAIFEGPTTIGPRAFAACTKLKEFHQPAASLISKEAFMGCGKLSIVNIQREEYRGYQESGIGSKAFYGCPNIDIQSILTYGPSWIGAGAFYGAKATELSTSSNTYRIAEQAFAGIIGLKQLTLRNSRMHIDPAAKIETKYETVNGKLTVLRTKHDLKMGFSGNLVIDQNNEHIFDDFNIPSDLNVVYANMVEDQKSLNIIFKSKALGSGINGATLTKKSDIVTVLKAFSDEEIEKMLSSVPITNLVGWPGAKFRLGDFTFSAAGITRLRGTDVDNIRTLDGAVIATKKRGSVRTFYILLKNRQFLIKLNEAAAELPFTASGLTTPIMAIEAKGRLMRVEKISDEHYKAHFNSGEVVDITPKTMLTSISG